MATVILDMRDGEADHLTDTLNAIDAEPHVAVRVIDERGHEMGRYTATVRRAFTENAETVAPESDTAEVTIPSLEDIANALTLVEGAIEEGMPLSDTQKVSTLAGALRSALSVVNTLLISIDTIPAEQREESMRLNDNDLMLLRSGHLLNTKILEACQCG